MLCPFVASNVSFFSSHHRLIVSTTFLNLNTFFPPKDWNEGQNADRRRGRGVRSGQKVIQRRRANREACFWFEGRRHTRVRLHSSSGEVLRFPYFEKNECALARSARAANECDKFNLAVQGAGCAVLSFLSRQSGNCLPHSLMPWCHQLAGARLSLGLRRCRLPPPVISR